MGLKRSLKALFSGQKERSPTKTNGDLRVEQGLAAFKDKRFTEAVAALKDAIEQPLYQHELVDVYNVLGKAFSALGQYEQAITTYQNALTIDPDNHQAWNNLGTAHYYLGHLDAAEECHRRALNIAPDYAYAYASLGAVHINREAPIQAIEALERAILLNSRIAVSHSNLALAQAMLGRFDEAESSLTQAITLGYENWHTIRKRIDNLKCAAQDKKLSSHDTTWLPAQCQHCGAPISASNVRWTSTTTADCAYCGVNLKSG